MKNQIIQPLHRREHKPKREPIPRTWFLSHGYTKADTRYTNGYAIWLHPKTNDVYSAYGKIKLRLIPYEKYKKATTRYLCLDRTHGNMYLARLKYLTFKGEIPAGYAIDHIDGNPLNNDIRNIRAVPRAINDRDGGFMRKLRNHGINVAMYHPTFIIEGYERMAEWKNSHNTYRYNQLDKNDLLRIFVGPTFSVIDPNILMEIEK